MLSYHRYGPIKEPAGRLVHGAGADWLQRHPAYFLQKQFRVLPICFYHTCLVLSSVCWNVMSKCFLAEGCLFLSPTLFLAFCVDALSGCSQHSGDPATLEVTLATEVFTDLHVPASWCRLAFWPHHHEELYKVLFLCRSIPLLPEAANPPQSLLSLLWCLSPQPAVSERFLFIISFMRAKVILARS